MDEDARQQALLTAVTTEHFVLQTSRSATIAESVGRATIFMSMLSAGLIGLGFVSSSGHLLRPYLGAVLPTLVITGLLTYARLVESMVENEVDLQRIQRIRAWYHHRFAGDLDFFVDALAQGGGKRAEWAAVGSQPGRVQMLLTTAALVGAVNALLIGLGATLLSGVFGAAPGLAIAVGVVVALAAFAVQIVHINRASISLGR
ncbi:hypothetical protein ONA91_05405 [Micromonospora sp. DR5-3]|uniref:hypothetical protein n=1 Tax=unclassified Micromonospora TaxID=2617518 RepID=UPI0011DC6E01|nr:MULTISPECIES: hypothetical protein [unclassified Micromonospora]MCW3813891.1 hypothetical protein [Micromonospora sp. DR5-3]TYC24563.1 hypothetical protein FXF52_09885 [Micromonospora sp. MP36]